MYEDRELPHGRVYFGCSLLPSGSRAAILFRTVAARRIRFSFSGQILTGPLAGLVNGITLETFDGYGSFVSKDHVVLNGVQPVEEWRESSGTYTVNPDCTGKKQVNFANNNPPPRITYFVITNSGEQLVIVGGNSGAALSGVYIRRNERHEEKQR